MYQSVGECDFLSTRESDYVMTTLAMDNNVKVPLKCVGRESYLNTKITLSEASTTSKSLLVRRAIKCYKHEIIQPNSNQSDEC